MVTKQEKNGIQQKWHPPPYSFHKRKETKQPLRWLVGKQRNKHVNVNPHLNYTVSVGVTRNNH